MLNLLKKNQNNNILNHSTVNADDEEQGNNFKITIDENKRKILRKLMKRWLKFMFEKQIKPKLKIEEENKFSEKKLTLCSEKLIIAEELYPAFAQNFNLYTEDIYEKEKTIKTNCLVMIDGLYKGELTFNYRREGHGCLYSNDGNIYTGNWHNNSLLGYSRRLTPEGSLYEGYFKGYSLIGKGKFLNSESTYEGTFQNFDFDGQGVLETKEFTYDGEFSNNKSHGKGTKYFKALSETYKGDFKDNEMTGVGHYNFQNGETYVGDFTEGKMNGKGVYTWPDKSEYSGSYANNIKEGKGIYKVNGKIIDSVFVKGKPHGKSKLTTKDGKTIDVKFEDGVLIKNKKKKINNWVF